MTKASTQNSDAQLQEPFRSVMLAQVASADGESLETEEGNAAGMLLRAESACCGSQEISCCLASMDTLNW